MGLFVFGLFGGIPAVLFGAIVGAIAGAVGSKVGDITNGMRESRLRRVKQREHQIRRAEELRHEKQRQYLQTVPGLFDTAENLSIQANTLFKQKNYIKALQTYCDALSDFTKANEGARSMGDTDLVNAISKNIIAIQKNIVSCKNSIGAEITGEAKSEFGNGDFEGALQSYRESLKYLEDPELVAKTEDNIETCYREIDARKVENLSNRAVSLLNEATSHAELFKAKDILKQSDDMLVEAVTIAMEQKFTEALPRLNEISKNIRTQRGVIDDRIAGGGEVVSEDRDIELVTATDLSISTAHVPTQFTTFRTVWDPNPGNRDFVWSREKPDEYGELPGIKQWISDKNPNIYWFLLKIVNRADHPVTEWNVTLYTEQALMITKAHLDDKRVRIVDSGFDTNKNRNKYVVSIPPELGVSIPAKGGTRLMYFETDIRCEDALKMEFGVSGVVKLGTTPQIEVPIREKRFTYACKYGDFKKMFYGSIDALASQVMENLQDSYRREIVQNFTNSFRLIRDFENYCKDRYAEPEILIDKLEAVYSSLRAAEPITKDEILPFVEENLDVIRKLGGAAPNVEAQKERGVRMCERLIGLLHQVKMGG